MFELDAFYFSATDSQYGTSLAESIYDAAWRTDLEGPGFAVLDLGVTDSRALRSRMVQLKRALSQIGIERGRPPFGYLSMMRFDQSETTRFHLDGAPAASLLMLGYEPSKIISRLFLADYVRYAHDRGIDPARFARDYNRQDSYDEALLEGLITEVPQPTVGHSRIVLINNSSLPFSESRTNPLGVMHKALIVTPDDALSRIVNSTMLAEGAPDSNSLEEQEEFVTTTEICRKVYADRPR